ncbi:MAG: tetratricopeptide repeat protein [Planctomycetota bacterium]
MTHRLRDFHRGIPQITPRSDRSSGKSRMRVLNVRLLVGTLIAVVLVTTTLFFWHKFQLASQARMYLEAADRTEKAEQWRETAGWLKQYLAYRPDDVDAMGRFAEATLRGARSAKEKLDASIRFAQVLDKDPDRLAERSRLAELQLHSNPKLADENARKVLASDPRHAGALKVRAKALDTMARQAIQLGMAPDTQAETLRGVAEAFQAALAVDPGDIELSGRAAVLFRQYASILVELEDENASNWSRAADHVVDAMVANSQDRVGALLARFNYRQRYLIDGNAPSAEVDDDLAEALAVAPKNVNVLLALADQLARLSLDAPILAYSPTDVLDDATVQHAMEYLGKATSIAPRDPRPFLGISELQTRRGDVKGALATLEKGLESAGQKQPILNARIAALRIRVGDWEGAWSSLDQMEQYARNARSRSLADEAVMMEAVANLLRAQWYVEDRNPKHSVVKATAHLQSAKEARVSDTFRTLVQEQLGTCHLALRQWDLAADNFRAVSRGTTGRDRPRMLVAESLHHAGRFKEAINALQEALGLARQRMGFDVSLILMPMASSMIAEQQRLPADRRNWRPFDEVLAELRVSMPNSYQLALLEIEADMVRQPLEQDKIAARLRDAEKKFADKPAFWQAAVDLYLALGRTQEAERCTDHLESLTKETDSAAKARLALARGNMGDAERILRESESNIEDADKLAMLASLAILSQHAGRLDESREPLRRQAAARPNDIGVRFLLGQIAAQVRDTEDLKHWEDELRELEGPNGSLWTFFRIQRLLILAEQGDLDQLAEASALCRQLLNRRPGWFLAHVAEGMIAEAQGVPSEAIAAYRYAFDLGDRRPALSRRLASLLIVQGMDVEAMTHFDQLPESTLLFPDLLPLVVQVAIRSGNPDRAVDLAQKGVASMPMLAENHVLLGQAYQARRMAGDVERAKAAFAAANQLRPGDLATWIATLYAFIGSTDPDTSTMSLEALRGIAELLNGSAPAPTDARQSYLLGRALQLAGDIKNADAFYRQALQEDGMKDPLVRKIPISAIVSGSLKLSEDVAWTGQIRAMPESVQKVFGAVLTASGSDEPGLLELMGSDHRLIAASLIARGGPDNQKQALARLEKIAASERTRGDWFLLAQLQRSAGNADAAFTLFRSMLSKDPLPAQLRVYGDFALQQNRIGDARAAINQLLRLQPQPGANLDLEVRTLKAEGQLEKAVALAKEVARSKPDPSAPAGETYRRSRFAAESLAEIGQPNEGEKILRDAAQKDSLGVAVLADWLSLQPGKLDEAIELCLNHADGNKARERAWLIANIMTQGSPKEELAQRAEKLYDEALAANDSSVSATILSLAVLREHQNRYDDAIALTRQALEKEPGNVLHLNNLAWFLSCAGKHEECLETLGPVIDAMGPTADILDTKGVALLGAQRPREAIRVLEGCVASPKVSPRTYLHLAEAYEAVGLHKESQQAFARAKELIRGSLPPRDRQAFDRLKG